MTKSEPKTKHNPVRTCIATGAKLPKNELMRFVRIADGSVVVDPYSKARGRGANLTMSMEAFDLAVKKHAFKRALKLEHDLSPEQVAKLREQFADAMASKSFRKGSEKIIFRVTKQSEVNSAK